MTTHTRNIPFQEQGDTFHLQCPRSESEVTISKCASCDHRGEINFLIDQVECFYPATTRAPTPEPPGDPDQDGITDHRIHQGTKKIGPYVECRKILSEGISPIRDCQACWHLVKITWSHVQCAFPKRGADFGGSRASAT